MRVINPRHIAHGHAQASKTIIDGENILLAPEAADNVIGDRLRLRDFLAVLCFALELHVLVIFPARRFQVQLHHQGAENHVVDGELADTDKDIARPAR